MLQEYFINIRTLIMNTTDTVLDVQPLELKHKFQTSIGILER